MSSLLGRIGNKLDRTKDCLATVASYIVPFSIIALLKIFCTIGSLLYRKHTVVKGHWMVFRAGLRHPCTWHVARVLLFDQSNCVFHCSYRIYKVIYCMGQFISRWLQYQLNNHTNCFLISRRLLLIIFNHYL